MNVPIRETISSETQTMPGKFSDIYVAKVTTNIGIIKRICLIAY